MGLTTGRDPRVRGRSLLPRRALLGAALVSLLLLSAVLAPCLQEGAACSAAALLLTPDQRGRRLFDDGRFEAAAAVFQDPAWRAAALYRAAGFERAAGIWRGMASPEAALGAGNALLMLGRYADAIERYDAALAARPDWEPARVNREVARLRAARVARTGDIGTGGQLEADEIRFEKGGADEAGGTEEVEGGGLSDESARAVWLRQVETRPADFLRAKFAYELARGAETP